MLQKGDRIEITKIPEDYPYFKENKIKVGDTVIIISMSGAVSSSDLKMVKYSKLKGKVWKVTHVNMVLPSYDIIPGTNRRNDTIIEGDGNILFVRSEYLKFVCRSITKYKVLFHSDGEVEISDRYYRDLNEFSKINFLLTPIHLIAETAKEFTE
jgi:hypothetical protein